MKIEKVDHPSKLKPRRLHGSFGWNIMEPFKPGADDIVDSQELISIWRR
jgi:hypothetical protein